MKKKSKADEHLTVDWINHPVTVRVAQTLRSKHYELLTTQANYVRDGKIDEARITVGKLDAFAELINLFGTVSAPDADNSGQSYDASISTDDNMVDPANDPTGRTRWLE